MKIITVSREFSSGGRELGKRLADCLGFEYYDKEIIASVAASAGIDENYAERMLEEGMVKRVPLSFRCSVSGPVVPAGGADGGCVVLLVTYRAFPHGGSSLVVYA